MLTALGLVAAAAAQSLTLAVPVPGEPSRNNTIAFSGATAGAQVSLFAGDALGQTPVAGCDPLDLEAGLVLATASADGSGAGVFTVYVEAIDAGRTQHLQAVQEVGCLDSDPLVHTWRVTEWVGVWDPNVADARVFGSDVLDVFASRVDLGDGDGDGLDDLAMAAPRDDDGGATSGGIYVVYGNPTGDVLMDLDEDLKLVGEEPNDWAGWGLAWAGDVDADGDSDLLVGSRLQDRNGPDSGTTYLILMPRFGVLDLADADAILVGESAGDQSAMDVRAGGDVDGDDHADIWIGAPFESSVAPMAGAAYLVRGPTSGEFALSEADAKLLGEAAGDQAGLNVGTLGDGDGDGLDDVVVGAEGSDRAAEDAGAAYVLYGEPSGLISLADADAVITGEKAADHAGASVTGAGDLDDDGLADLIVSARDESSGGPLAGAAYVLYGQLPAEVPLATAALQLTGEGDGDYAGAHVDTCDVDGDGWLDLLVTSHHAGPGEQTGRVYLFYGPLPVGQASLGTADAIFIGVTGLDNLGQDLACGNVDGDPYADTLIGAEGVEQDHGGYYSGAAYLLTGRPRVAAPPTTDTGGPTVTDPTEPTETTDTAPPNPDTGPSDGKDKGCGCASPVPSAPWALAAALVLAGFRRRR